MGASDSDVEGAGDRSKMCTSDRSKVARWFPCKFCKKPFRNAQALGGHMNVHRRERNLAKDLMQMHYDTEQPQQQHVDAQPRASKLMRGAHHQYQHQKIIKDLLAIQKSMHDRFMYAGPSSSASSTSPPDIAPGADFFASSSRTCREDKLLSGGCDLCVSSHPAVDLELRLGHRTPD